MIVGHFANLTEAQKLVRSELLAGVVQQIYEEGQLLQKLPVTTINAKSLIYNRESVLPSAAQYDIHEQIPWTADVGYTDQVEVALTRTARQDVLDKFMMKTYKTPNDYRAIVLGQLRKGCMRTIEDFIIYGDGTGKNPTGLDKLCPAVGGDTFAAGKQDQDHGGAAAGAMSVVQILNLIGACKPRPDVLLMRRTVKNMLWKYSMGKAGALIMASTPSGFGTLIESVNGVPILVSDYLVDEADNSGGKSSGTGLSSIYAVRFGPIEDGGLCLVTGGDTGGVDFFEMVEIDNLENYDASGIRLVAYWNLALGSTKAIARIHSFEDVDGFTD